MEGSRYGSPLRYLCSGLALLSVALSSGCEEPDDGSLPPLSEAPTPAGPGRASKGCQGWRDASCDYAARCGMRVERCNEQYGLIGCRSEEEADRCANTIDAARCGSLPDDCRPALVAHSVPAIDACAEFVEAVCESATVCKLVGSFAECTAQPGIDCRRALGVRADFTQCLSALDALSCAGWLPPAECIGAVLLGPD